MKKKSLKHLRLVEIEFFSRSFFTFSEIYLPPGFTWVISGCLEILGDLWSLNRTLILYWFHLCFAPENIKKKSWKVTFRVTILVEIWKQGHSTSHFWESWHERRVLRCRWLTWRVPSLWARVLDSASTAQDDVYMCHRCPFQDEVKTHGILWPNFHVLMR